MIQSKHQKFGIESYKNSLDFLWVELTNKCNLKCVHCYADSSPFNPLEQKISFQGWKNIILEATQVGCKKIQFIGGEPTVYPMLKELIEYTNSLGYELIEVYTNATNISDELFKTFVSENVSLAISVYGHTASVHELITQRKDSYEKTMTNILKAQALKIPIRISIIEMESNKDEIAGTIEKLENLGITNIGVDKVRGIGRGNDEVKSSNDMDELCGACWQGQLVVDSNGDIFPCVFSRFRKIGNIDESIKKILEKSELGKFRSEIKAIDDQRNLELVDSEIQGASCSPYCKPNCNPYSNCRPKCGPRNDVICRPF